MTFFRSKTFTSEQRKQQQQQESKQYGSASAPQVSSSTLRFQSRRRKGRREEDLQLPREVFDNEHDVSSPSLPDEENIDEDGGGGGGGGGNDELKVSSHVMEYSDTSEEQDAHHRVPSRRRRTAEMSSKNGYKVHRSESASSMRVVRFNSSFSDDDDDLEELGGANIIQHSDSQEVASPPPPPPALGLLNSKRTNSSSSQEQQCHGKQSHSKQNQEQLLKRKTHRKQHIHPSKSPDWMTQLAYSFRSPSPLMINRKQLISSAPMHTSSENMEFPPNIPGVIFGSTPAAEAGHGNNQHLPRRSKINAEKGGSEGRGSDVFLSNERPQQDRTRSMDSLQAGEVSPLLGSAYLTSSLLSSDTEQCTVATQKYVALAAAYLRDYEGGRAPVLSTDLQEVTDRQLRFYEYKYGGYTFQICLVLASFAFFVASMLEGFDYPPKYSLFLTILNLIGLSVFIVDIWFRSQLRGSQHTRASRSERLIKPLILFAIILSFENITRIIVSPNHSIVLFSSLFKPLVLFYLSSKGRDALEALRRIIRIVFRVLLMELLLILMFAAVACRLFHQFNEFRDLVSSWLSLFELSTTVVNPSIWMPIYQHSPCAAAFFVVFIVTFVFYLHSLVLSVVLSTYVQAAAEIHERSSGDREDAIQLAFVALQQQQKQNVVEVGLLRETLRILRPHYNAMKINALVEIVDPTNQQDVDFATFRTKIRQALNASIRTARSATSLATLVELIAVANALMNFGYVIMVSSKFHAPWFDNLQEEIGSIITFVAGFELLIRFNPLRIPDFTPLTRLNATFDGLALVACLMSMAGILLYLYGFEYAIEYILIGRALDMIRIMRFFQIFRDVVRRSSEVMPALTGPIILVTTALHIFVYLGIALWGGAVQVGQHFGEITYLYDLNNFNSYAEGVITMFQVLVVNDWHAIAEVFLFADRCSSPLIVYPFFILANLIGVSVMLNVLTAFFVETFVTKLDDGTSNQVEATTTVQKERNFSILGRKDKDNMERATSKSDISERDGNQDSIDQGADADSEASSEDLYEFDVYEREGFDKIMETVTGNAQNNDFAEQMCSYLDIFEGLTPGREKVGYLICDLNTMERISNRHFQKIAVGFLSEPELVQVVNEMNAELLALSARATFSEDRPLRRTFQHRRDPNQIMDLSASLLRRHPAVSLFVLRPGRSPAVSSSRTLAETSPREPSTSSLIQNP